MKISTHHDHEKCLDKRVALQYVCVEVYRKYRGSGTKEEVVFREKIERDIKPGETYTKDYRVKSAWFLRECDHTIYVDCVLSDGLKFRDGANNTPLTMGKQRRLSRTRRSHDI